MSTIASQITSLTIVYSTIYLGADQSKHQSSASLAFVWVIHRGPVNSPHKWPVTRKLFPFDDVIMWIEYYFVTWFFEDCHRTKEGNNAPQPKQLLAASPHLNYICDNIKHNNNHNNYENNHGVINIKISMITPPLMTTRLILMITTMMITMIVIYL